jgi:DNA-directed RNA polymerase specialized sigma24 family protein
VLVLHDIEGWTHEDIGNELGMATGTSKAQLHRARGLLRKVLGDNS